MTMELSLLSRWERISHRLRLAFWRSVSACIATVMRAPPALRALLTALPLLILGGFAYVLGRAAGGILTGLVR
jgi:hypothetical protein